MKKLPLLILAILALGALSALAAGRQRQAGTETEDTRKADYIYLEALRAKSQSNHDAAFALLQRAHELNPADREIGVELSTYLLSLSQTDSALLTSSMALLRDYCEANPTDIYYGGRYAMLNEQLLNRDEALRTWKRLHTLYPDRLEVTYRYAGALAQGGTQADRDKAIAVYDSVEIAEGKSIPLSSKKIQLYYSLQDTASILAEADRLRNSAPRNVDFQVFSGDIYSMFGLNDQAKQFYDSACILDPSSGLAYYSRAQFYHTLGDSAAFNREVFQALEQKNLNVETKLVILRSYIQEMFNDSTNFPQIGQLFDVLIDQHPHEHDIHDLYSRYLIVTKDYSKAAEQTERALDLDPADSEGWEMLTSLYLQVDRLDDARQAIKRSLRYYPDNSRQYLVLGSIYDQEGQRDKATAEYRHALSLTDSTDVSQLSRIYGAMGDNLYASEQADSAFVYYQKSLLYDPDNTLALNNCAYYLACEGRDLDRALEMIEKAVGAEPENATSMDTYAWVLFKRKDYAKAREIIDRTLSLTDERSEEILEHAGDIYFMDGDPDGALRFWKEALELAPDNQLLAKKVKHKTYFFK
ncbi:tetratricopeptide repeat protein [Muribaculaceae bacterium Isolate-039 (Harlan)]|jgi:tetratricopeptide (TPR) repeat protein|uniref:tetratricopeptide repeat protein n=1 Tax=Duncaniella TaxID=2518495 RepID=UPI000F4998A9|nr:MULTISPECIES: tetratricopeptide repeat protein [Duncaniella]ROS91861.1 tetratricopeptide repeat protein [Muribaculaceae bacterium Isolate-039 (Harlan)]ROT00100.1 tetratricopeptide repeat protein [Muribaculaceae bacterium Isolate-083 (Janvier)]ROT00527.1 tetratricopeptide repeat protein [Muribaculaceae bacterium Isolate-077 (Janvier)]ROT02832.1 tetratricopeptide repeat protein [Muribaculaceae bacterium Isolate-084 (Janvier)]QCD38319.1 tetratricopeptide repeat protein [Duncaniella sp. C9]